MFIFKKTILQSTWE